MFYENFLKNNVYPTSSNNGTNGKFINLKVSSVPQR